MGNASKLTSIQKRKRLEALYSRGEYVRFGPDGVKSKDDEPADDDILIWVGPPSPLQREMAIRESQAQRSRALLEARLEEGSSQYLNARAFLSGLTNDDLADYVMDLDEAERLSRARREVLVTEEWEDFNSLRDLMRQFEDAGAPADDPEWAGLMKRDREFGEAVMDRADILRAADREGYSLMPRVEIEKKALEKRIDQAGSQVFMKTYEENMLFYSCRNDEDHTELFFTDLADMRSMPEEVQDALAESLAQFVGEAAEAKNSQAAGSGSPSSVPVSEPVTSQAYSPDPSVGF